MSKAIINALTLALAECEAWGGSLSLAREFAADFFVANEDLFQQPPLYPLHPPATPAQLNLLTPEAEHVEAPAYLPGERAVVHRVPVVGSDGLTDQQRAAVGKQGLCSNCQQPNNAHLPGCAVASGENPRAVTKAPLSPVQ